MLLAICFENLTTLTPTMETLFFLGLNELVIKGYIKLENKYAVIIIKLKSNNFST